MQTMAFLGVKGYRKVDLRKLAVELCLNGDDTLKALEIKNSIQNSDVYRTDNAFVQSIFEAMVVDRLAQEAKELEEKKSQAEERKRREEQEFELQKLRL